MKRATEHILITKRQKKILNKMRVIKEQPYHEVLENLLNSFKVLKEKQ